MSWNYRIIRYKLKGNESKFFGKYMYKIHEVFYDENNNIDAWTFNRVSPIGSSKEELIEDLDMVKKDCLKYPILDGNILESESEKKKPNYERAIIDG